MDFTEPPLPIDNVYNYIFTVKDMGSGKLLLSLPVERESAEAVVPALRMLFTALGPPLVLKSDNGSAFKSGALRRLLEKWEVKPLYSPSYYPQYNGACEAGIGTLKTYAHYQAVRNDRPGEWSCDDVEAARMRANECSRPFGRHGPSPDTAWSGRKPITANEREEFMKGVETTRCAMKSDDDDEKNKDEILRDAIEIELLRSGYLSYRRRRISSPIKKKMVS
jgi:transposase InsO family protein